MSNAQRFLAAQEGYEFNQYNGVYKNGAKYDHRKKLEVAAFYLELQDAGGGARPSITAVAQGCKVSRDYVRTVEKELRTHGTIFSGNDAPPRNCDRGFGVHTRVRGYSAANVSQRYRGNISPRGRDPLIFNLIRSDLCLHRSIK